MSMILQKVHFACILDQIQKQLHVHLDTHIVQIMYHEYMNKLHDMYTLFELISLLNEQNIYITCTLNKKALWKMIIDKQISIPYSDNKQCIEWYIYNMYNTEINIIAIKNLSMRMEIIEGDIYMIDDNVYKVTRIIASNANIILNEDITMSIDTFINKIDEIILNNVMSGRTLCIDEMYGC